MASVATARIKMVEVVERQVKALGQPIIQHRPDLCRRLLPWLLFQGFGKDLFWGHHS